MKLEVGKKYLTKGGSVVKIYYNTDELGFMKHLQPFGGMIEGRGSAFYAENGIYNFNKPDSEFNIVEEIK